MSYANQLGDKYAPSRVPVDIHDKRILDITDKDNLKYLFIDDENNIVPGYSVITNDSSSVEGNPITIEDALDSKLNSFLIYAVPTQNLHGYDKPWAAGCYLNKYSGENISVSSGEFFDFSCLPNTFYTIAFVSTHEFLIESNLGVSISKSHIEVGQNIVTFTSPEEITSSNLFKVVSLPSSTATLTYCYAQQGEVENYSYTPYANVCPITGHDHLTVTIKQREDSNNNDAFIRNFSETVYGGIINCINGKVVILYGFINSYNGEELPAGWISSIDSYEEGSTPSIGAQVVYELDYYRTIDIESIDATLNLNENYIYNDVGSMSIEYFRGGLLSHNSISSNEDVTDMLESILGV